MIPVTMVDITGLQAAEDVIERLRARGVTFIAAGRETEWRNWSEKRRVASRFRTFPTLRAAVKTFQQENPAATAQHGA
jgi:hypothetical protein